MAIYEGAGIHGTEETSSLGSAASHGSGNHRNVNLLLITSRRGRGRDGLVIKCQALHLQAAKLPGWQHSLRL